MSKLKSDNGFKTYDIEAVANKKIVFIIDECHRSTFGEMLVDIKATFPRALYFGFTGTPILEENQKKSNTQTDLFGNELHRYSIADGIRDGNVLPFDPRQVRTFKDSDLKRVVALQEAKASTIKEAVSDRRKQVIYNHFINKVDMAGHYDLSGDYIKGIEDFINTAQYERDDTKKIETQHQYYVVLNILENWELTSVANKYHAIFATSSIKEAIQYYRLFKEMMGKNGLPTLKITCLFDQSIDNDGGATDKEEALVEILTDYNVLYKKTYTIPTYYYFKKDVSARLAHKDKYLRFENMDEDHLDLLIVVDQMLTGYDSKWVNTLYLDKKLRNEAIVQAFSRTNRINDSDKPYGIIKYYRYPHTMEKNIDKAFELYSGNRPYGIFVDKLPRNMKKVSELYQQIKALFVNAGIPDFVKLPEDQAARGKFASLFSQLNKILISSKLQGFQWGKTDVEYNLEINEKIYYILAQRYKELFIIVPGVPIEGAAFDIDATCLEINTDKIDAAYLNSQFDKYVIEIQENRKDGPLAENIYGEIHRSFAMLNQEEQRFAEEIIFDLQNGNLFVKKGKTFRDYLNDYQERNKNDQIHRFATLVGYDEALLRELVDKRLNLSNIDAYGQFDPLRESLNVDVAKKYFEDKYEKKVSVARARRDAENLVRDFILQGGFDI